ncbi:DoxX family protein [Vibrio salinus]|uniref:DoxX family protein n=1 Tax=Vibrio salinus TaxID=2899784 RepID=UPI001E554F5C|nr:DoxX family protein [Vibrio salinus]MCE0495976.1 DoxX family protein [Vibrio salinus]
MANSIITKLLDSKSGASSLILRVPVGLTLAAHGSQKLFAWFGGYGLTGTGQWMDSIGFHPGFLMALLAGSAEFFGGLALVLGLFTRPAALVTAFTMLMAFTHHYPNGLFLANDGFEYALTLLAVTTTLLFQGAGRYSIDQWLFTKLSAQNR